MFLIGKTLVHGVMFVVLATIVANGGMRLTRAVDASVAAMVNLAGSGQGAAGFQRYVVTGL